MNKNAEKKKQINLFSHRNILCMILLASFLIPLLTLSIFKAFYYDEGYLYYSYLETRGQHVFVDYSQMMQKPPGIIWILVPIIYFFGHGFEALLFARMFLILIVTLTVLIVYYIALKIFGNKKIALLSAFFFGISPLISSIVGLIFTETPTVFFFSLAFLSYLSESKYKYYLSGILVGLSCLFRQTSIIFAAFFFLFILIYENKKDTHSETNSFATFMSKLLSRGYWKDKSIKLTKYLFGILIGVSPLLFYIIVTNSYEAFIRSVFIFNIYYTEILGEGSIIAKIWGMVNSFRFDSWLLLLLVGGLIFYVFIAFRNKNLKQNFKEFITKKKYQVFLVFWLLIFLLYYTQSFAFQRHYLYEIMVPICIISAKVLNDIMEYLKQKKIQKMVIKYFFALLIIISLIASIMYPLRLITNNDYYIYQEFKKYNPDIILTDKSQFLFLFGKTCDYYMLEPMEIPYERSGLANIFGIREIRNISAYVEKYQPDIIYLPNRNDNRALISFNTSNYTEFYISDISPVEYREMLYLSIRKTIHSFLSKNETIIPAKYYINNNLLKNNS